MMNLRRGGSPEWELLGKSISAPGGKRKERDSRGAERGKST